MDERQVSVRDGIFEIDVLEAGSGDPLLYLHGIGGLEWGEHLEQLAQSHHVIAPRHPGFGGSTGTDELADLPDLVYYYLDLLDEMQISNAVLVGHSLGGMIAAELAAVQPQRFSRVVLISPFGIWNEAHPGLDIFGSTPDEFASSLYADADSDAALAVAGKPPRAASEASSEAAQNEATIAFMLERAKAMSTAAKYLWPIPNKGLKKRIHRITQPVLILWGEVDGITPPALADDFDALLSDSRIEHVAGAAHMAPSEQPERVAELIGEFIGVQ
jgi:pimeloyl-ACP methyl ester carboxylesterase